MKIYVLGKKGFVAKKLYKFFEKKKIKAFFIGSKDIDLTQKKFRKKINFKKNSKIIFLSAITPDKGKDLLTFEKNVSMVINFLNNSNLNDISKFIYISSDAVYSLKQKKISDNVLPSPDDLYGLMHLTRENILKKVIEPEKLLILRPTIMYGKGDTHNSYGPNRFIKQIKNGEKIKIFGKGMDIRDHLYINDFVKVIYKSCSKKNLSGDFIVASQKSFKFIDVAKQILFLKNKPKNFIELIKVKNKVSIRYFSNLKISKILNIKFTKIKDGLEEYLK
tara:strand:+ start:849 stop:1679 length:831 start_codon:yes stop_codon:yes gene_type:complete